MNGGGRIPASAAVFVMIAGLALVYWGARGLGLIVTDETRSVRGESGAGVNKLPNVGSKLRDG